MSKIHPQQISLIPQPDRPLTLHIPESERPLNRLREIGAYGLSAVEILSVILGQKDWTLAHRLLDRFPTLRRLADADIELIAQIDGIGPAGAARLNAALELARRLLLEDTEEKWQIRTPSDAAVALRALLPDNTREHFLVLNLDTRNRIVHRETLYTGSLNTSICRIAEVFHYAIANHCAGIVIGHNHPSGDPDPSPEDVSLTRRLVDAGKLLEIDVLDHVILGGSRYVSLRERALGFESA